jgi:hypothetical protein
MWEGDVIGEVFKDIIVAMPCSCNEKYGLVNK